MSFSTPSDSSSALMQRQLDEARAGTPESVGRLLESCRDYLLLVANQEVGPDLQDKAGASDLVQETLAEAVRDFEKFRGDSADEFFRWMRQILVNNLANFRRRYSHSAKREVSRERSLTTGSGREAFQLQADVSSPSSVAVHNEERAAVERAIDRLPEHYRNVIVWRQREQCAFTEIGSRLDISGDAARKLWVRALERLANELGSCDAS